ncbi:MAG: ribosomal protein S18-alanine N-acetyltransferase [Chloroflexota bacterium]
MRYSVRPMQEEDIDQIVEIDQESFPFQWPYPAHAYRRELNNRLASYIVAVEKGVLWNQPENRSLQPLLQPILRLLRRTAAAPRPSSATEYIAGFAGVWRILDEAHLTTIAVRKEHRLRGVGELLLISIIEMAMRFGASVVTLEVRVSNDAAQELYRKYGFNNAGIRRGYYSEEGEDGLIMTTEPITSEAFRARFQTLKEQLCQRMDQPMSTADTRP